MDKISKFILHLTPKERAKLEKVIRNIIEGKLSGYDLKKMKGHANLYRVRIGNLRIVFIDLTTEQRILMIDGRNDNTYKDF
jgi:mRNA-degrading endonuclease RelE of RelBE toxin-antitoxin system